MTNKEAIEIVEDMIVSMDDIDVLLDEEREALNYLMKIGNAWDAIMNGVPHYVNVSYKIDETDIDRCRGLVEKND